MNKFSVEHEAAIDKVLNAGKQLKQFIYERDELIDGVMIATISHDGVAVIGPKGTSKTLVGRLWSQFIDPDEVFEVMEQPGLNPEYEFGPLDIKRYTETGEQVRNTKNMMPSKKFVLIDEADKASDAVRFGQFPIIHPEERRFFNMSAGVQAAKAKFVYMTMNTKDRREELEPYFDRIALTFRVGYISERQNRINFLRSIWNQSAAKFVPPYHIGWDTIEMLHELLAKVQPTDDAMEALEKIDSELRKENVPYSDRKIGWLPRLAKAKALLDKRLYVRQDDLVIAVDMLWESFEDRSKIEDIIMRCLDSAIVDARILYNDAFDVLAHFRRESEKAENQNEDERTRKRNIRNLAFDANDALMNIASQLNNKAKELQEKYPNDAKKIADWATDVKERSKQLMNSVLGFEVGDEVLKL